MAEPETLPPARGGRVVTVPSPPPVSPAVDAAPRAPDGRGHVDLDPNASPPRTPLARYLPERLWAGARFTEPQNCYGDPRECAVFVRDLLELLRERYPTDA